MSDRMPPRAVTCLGCVQYRVTAKILAKNALSRKQYKIEIETWKTDRKSYVTYQLAPITMTLKASLFEYFLYSCAVFDKISTDIACSRGPRAVADLLFACMPVNTVMFYHW